jgi:DNA polymerase-1
MKQQTERAETDAYITTLFGRRISLDRNAHVKGWMQRLALNAPMQGSAAEIIKKAMVDVSKHPFGTALQSLLQVHDELIFEVQPSILQECLPFIRKTMENAATLSVPLIVNIKSGHNWENLELC